MNRCRGEVARSSSAGRAVALALCDSDGGRIGPRPREEAMASKDKGGKSTKTAASKTLKQKRAAKRDKKTKGSEHRAV
jgi:hypothetical protein